MWALLRLSLRSCCIADLVGDGFFFSVVEQNRQKVWVTRIYVVYIIFFSLSCLVSGLSMLVKMQIIRQKFASRHNSVAAAPTTAARAPLQATPRSRQLTDFTKSVAAAADVARMESKKKVAHLEEKVRVPSRQSDCYARARSSVWGVGWGWGEGVGASLGRVAGG